MKLFKKTISICLLMAVSISLSFGHGAANLAAVFPHQEVVLKKHVNGKPITQWWTSANATELINSTAFKLYAVADKGAAITGTPYANGKLNADGKITFTPAAVPWGWYAVVEELSGTAAEIFQETAPVYIYVGDKGVEGADEFNTSIDHWVSYSWVSGGGSVIISTLFKDGTFWGDYKEIFDNEGNLIERPDNAIYNITMRTSRDCAYIEYPSFCAYYGSRFFGEDKPYTTGNLDATVKADILSAFNYIYDTYGSIDAWQTEGALTVQQSTKIMSQIIVWLMVDKRIDIMKAVHGAGGGPAQYEIVNDAIADVLAHYKGYKGLGAIKDIIYLVGQSFPSDILNTQPQVVPVFNPGIVIHNITKCGTPTPKFEVIVKKYVNGQPILEWFGGNEDTVARLSDYMKFELYKLDDDGNVSEQPVAIGKINYYDGKITFNPATVPAGRYMVKEILSGIAEDIFEAAAPSYSTYVTMYGTTDAEGNPAKFYNTTKPDDCIGYYTPVIIPPTCDYMGWTIYQHSCDAGLNYIDDTVPALKFTYTAEVTAPTCTDNGFTTWTNCAGDSYITDIVPAIGYFNVVVVQPTCNEEGYTMYIHSCNKDLTYIADTVPAMGHNYKIVVTEPTCDAEGFTTHISDCDGSSFVDSFVPALNTIYTSEITAPTCNENGFTTWTNCAGDSYITDVTPAIGHNYTTVVTPPTCTEEGYTTYTSDCDGSSFIADITPAIGFPTVTFEQIDTLCAGSNPIDLSDYVTPQGGTFTGAGVTGTMFNPAAAKIGSNTVTYTIDNNGCEASISIVIVVKNMPKDSCYCTPKVCVDVEINKTNFPDDNFRAFISEKYDLNKDGILSCEERLHIQTLDASDREIGDVTGICYFENLKAVHVHNNKLTVLDVSCLEHIQTLEYCNNPLIWINKGVAKWVIDCVNRGSDSNSDSNSNSNSDSNSDGGKYGECKCNIDPNHTHSFTVRGALISHATCESPATYKVKCSICGVEHGTATMFYGESLNCEPAAECVIAVNATNFPDANFRDFILNNYDADKDGFITCSQAHNVKVLDIMGLNIADLTGICYFTNLQTLHVQNNNLTELDVTCLAHLQTLNCSNNQLTLLNINGLGNLKYLDTRNNKLTATTIKSIGVSPDEFYSDTLTAANAIETIAINVYPNPTTDKAYLTAPANIQLYTQNGKLLYSGFGSEIDLSNYAQGVYLVKINGNSVVKVIKQ